MAEKDILRNSATHHGRRHRNTPHRVDSDDVNSHISESTRSDDENTHHEEKNPHKERDTKMTKRTKRGKRIISSLAVSIMFIVSLSVYAANITSRDQLRDEIRANTAQEIFRTDARFDVRESRLDNRGAFITDQRNNRFQLDFNGFDYRTQSRNWNSFINRKDSRSWDRLSQNQFISRGWDNLSLQRVGINRLDYQRLGNQFASRADVNRFEGRFAANRVERAGYDAGLGVERNYSLNRFAG